MIKSFRHKGLEKYANEDVSKGLPPDLLKRISIRLQFLKAAVRPESMNKPGFNFHELQGKPKRYSVHVNGPWCITFGWDGDGAVDVDFENYH